MKTPKSATRRFDEPPPTPNLPSPGQLGLTVMQDLFRATFDNHNQLLHLFNVPVDAVFIGDSLTNMIPWQHLLTDLFPVAINRGVGGDSAAWLGRRLEADVLVLKPRHAILMIGTNDISARFGYDSDARIVADYERNLSAIVRRIRRAGITLWLGTVPPARCIRLNDVEVQRKQACIPRFNAVVRKLARRERAHVVDYYPHFLDQDGRSLRADLATDHVHLNARGQYLMVEILRDALRHGGITADTT
jgi:lysophospholipase L1-like esterase